MVSYVAAQHTDGTPKQRFPTSSRCLRGFVLRFKTICQQILACAFLLVARNRRKLSQSLDCKL
jgi:hypothetical protein